MRKKEVFVILGFTIIIVSALFYMYRANQIKIIDPNYSSHGGAKAVLDTFYNEFMNNDHVTKKMERLFVGETAGKLTSFREDFGEIRDYEIYQIKDKGDQIKEAKIRVETVLKNGRLQTIVDTITLVSDNGWCIYDYETTNRAMHPYIHY